MIHLHYLQDGAVALVTLERPPANAFTPEGLLHHLQQTIERLNHEPRVRALVITGNGPKFFSAGAYLNTFADGIREVASTAATRFGAALEALHNARMIVIATNNGYAMGGGLECALACDIRITETHALMALPETAVGLLPCGCGTQTLPWLVGEGWAKRMILTGERIDAPTALRIGLVEEVVETGAARKAALKMAGRVVTLSPQAVTFSKVLVSCRPTRSGVTRLKVSTLSVRVGKMHSACPFNCYRRMSAPYQKYLTMPRSFRHVS